MMRMKFKKLSVVIPAYNEEENLNKGVLQEVWDYLNKQKYSWELLIVDDESTDNTLKLVEKFVKSHKNVRALKEPHRGKGGTVIAGMLAAKGDIVLFTDMDQATPINQIEKLLPKFEQGYDGVIGSRKGRKGAPFVRKLMGWGFATLRNIILGLPFKDTQCGFKAFTREASENIFKRMKIFDEKKAVQGAAVNAGFDLEMLYIARKLGYKVAEVPVIWHHKGTERVSAIKDSWEGFRDLMRVRLNAIFGMYKV